MKNKSIIIGTTLILVMSLLLAGCGSETKKDPEMENFVKFMAAASCDMYLAGKTGKEPRSLEELGDIYGITEEELESLQKGYEGDEAAQAGLSKLVAEEMQSMCPEVLQ